MNAVRMVHWLIWMALTNRSNSFILTGHRPLFVNFINHFATQSIYLGKISNISNTNVFRSFVPYLSFTFSLGNNYTTNFWKKCLLFSGSFPFNGVSDHCCNLSTISAVMFPCRPISFQRVFINTQFVRGQWCEWLFRQDSTSFQCILYILLDKEKKYINKKRQVINYKWTMRKRKMENGNIGIFCVFEPAELIFFRASTVHNTRILV